MKSIFYIYWIWYVVSLLFLASGIGIDLMWARIFGMSMYLNYAFLATAPLYYLIYSEKGHASDQKYLNACLYSIIIRTLVWCFAFWGLNDHKLVLALNAFGIFVFVLIEKKLKQISGEYFNF